MTSRAPSGLSALAAKIKAQNTTRETEMQHRITQLEGQVRELQSSLTTMAPSWARRVTSFAPARSANNNNVDSAHEVDTVPTGGSLAELALWAQADETAESRDIRRQAVP